MTLTLAKGELQDALQLLVTASALTHRAIGNPGCLAEVDGLICAAAKQVQCALTRIARPAPRRPLSKPQRRALSALAAAPMFTLSNAELRAAIGRYATNVIDSLQSRRLITRAVGGGAWRLTHPGAVRAKGGR